MGEHRTELSALRDADIHERAPVYLELAQRQTRLLRRQILRDFFGIGYLIESVSVFRRLREHIGAHDLEQIQHAVETEF